jgi:carboxyl-terminal processing protease
MNLVKYILAVLITALCGIPQAVGLAPVSEETEHVYETSSCIVARQLPRLHLSQIPLNDQVAVDALDNFINALDYDHSYFLAGDVREFRREARLLDNKLRIGEIDFPLLIYTRFIERVSNRVDYVQTVLDEGFDFSREETYRWKRKKAPWPETREEWDRLWRRKIKNQYLSRKIADIIEEEQQGEAPDTPEPMAGSSSNATVESEAVAAAQEDTADAGPTNTVSVLDVDLTPEEEIYKQYRQYLSVLSDNDAHWLYPLYITSFARAYDPHSDYMSANNTEDFDINMKLSLVGIGALLSTEDGAAKVVRLIPGGPAEQDGRLQPGDKIIAVGQGDEQPVEIIHWPLSRSVRLIRGERNTKVVLVVIPASDISGTTTKKIDLIRDEVKLEERAAKGRVETLDRVDGEAFRLGVISIPDFYADVEGRNRGLESARSVTRDVQRILMEFKTNDVDGVLLDLRNNGGGLLNEAIEMTGLFIDSGPVVQVKSSQGVQVLSDADPMQVYDGPMVVLVNRQSASASEILAGALKDYGRAVIIGDSKTHGKGTVQSLISLRRSRPELGTLKFTTASFYRIAGGSTQREGIRPDIVIPSMLDFMEIGEEYLPHALPWTLVDPALYRPEKELNPIIPKLRLRSVKRRENDERFISYEGLLDHLGRKQQATNISLNLEERLEMARREKEMAELMNEHETEVYAAEESSREQQNDIVLDEALRILADLVELESGPAPKITDVDHAVDKHPGQVN